MHRIRASACCTCLVLGLLAPDAPAAGTVTVDRTCYSDGDTITETGTGFTPNTQLVESLSLLAPESGSIVDQLFSSPVTTDAAGAFTRTMPTPKLGRRTDRRETPMGAFTEQGIPNPPATVQWTLSGWDLMLNRGPGRISARSQVRVDTWGWTTAGTQLYMHHFRAGKRVKTTLLGDLAQPCGDLFATTSLFPSRAKPGRWKVYFSATARLDRENDGWFSYKLTLPRSRGPARTSGMATRVQRHRAAR